MAERTDCSASSGVTSSAGGGCRPIRCNAASTPAMSARRPSSEARSVAFLVVQRRQTFLGGGNLLLDVADAGGGIDQLAG